MKMSQSYNNLKGTRGRGESHCKVWGLWSHTAWRTVLYEKLEVAQLFR